MRRRGFQVFAAGAGALLCAVGAPMPGPAGAADAGVIELEWEDLQPPGEDEILDRLYRDYFAELDERMRAELAEPLSYEPGAAEDLIIEEGSELDMMVQIGTFNVVEELDGKTVRIPGFIVPFEFSPNDVYTEFLFVPYFGACVHTPPPPPNQILYVTLGEPGIIRDIYRPLWIEGVLTTERNENELGDAAYTLRLRKVEPYEG